MDIVYWLFGGIAVPLIQALKDAIGARGFRAFQIAVLTSISLTVIAVFVVSDSLNTAFADEDILPGFGQVLAGATIFYRLSVQDAMSGRNL